MSALVAHVARAHDAPGPTLVLDARLLPSAEADLLDRLGALRAALADEDAARLLKIAVVGPSPDPGHDLDYRFVQALPTGPDDFDVRGTCGHSLLAAVVVAQRTGLLAPLAVGRSIRVRDADHGSAVCRVDRVDGDTAELTVDYAPPSPVPLARLLPLGAPMTLLDAVEVPGSRGRTAVSLVSSGNPYVFVDARRLGVRDAAALFGAGDALLGSLGAVRAAVARRAGTPPDSVFPKIAAVLPDAAGIAVRAVTVPAWHPAVALTGAVCLAAAVHIPGTVPRLVAEEAAGRALGADGLLTIRSPGGRTAVRARTAGAGDRLSLLGTTVAGKVVTWIGPLVTTVPAVRAVPALTRPVLRAAGAEAA